MNVPAVPPVQVRLEAGLAATTRLVGNVNVYALIGTVLEALGLVSAIVIVLELPEYIVVVDD